MTDRDAGGPDGDALQQLRLLVDRQAERIVALEAQLLDRDEPSERARQALIRAERVSVLGKLSGVVSHELRNPLGVIRSSTFYLQMKLGDAEPKILKHLERIEQQVVICDEVIDELLEFTRGSKPDLVAGDVNEWLTSVIETMELPGAVRLAMKLDAELPGALFDSEKMRRVVSELVDNALQAVQARAESFVGFEPALVLSTESSELGVCVRVSDNGVGMEELTASQAFEPLFTTRARGVGMGLAIVKKIIDEHGGSVHLMSRPGEGTTVSLVLPYAAPGFSAGAQGAAR